MLIAGPARQSQFLEDKMQKLSEETGAIMTERFGHDNVIALATIDDGVPCVRYVNAFYENKSFYVITYALSGKMCQIQKNPVVALAGDWFTAHGKAESLGFFGRSENAAIAEKLRSAFASWIDNGHNNFSDENTCILRIRLTDGVLWSHGTCHDIDFSD